MAPEFVYFSTYDYGHWYRESFIKNWEWNLYLGKIWAGKYYLNFPPLNSLGSSLKLINHPLCPIYCHQAPDLLYCFTMKKTFDKSLFDSLTWGGWALFIHRGAYSLISLWFRQIHSGLTVRQFTTLRCRQGWRLWMGSFLYSTLFIMGWTSSFPSQHIRYLAFQSW